MKQARLNLDLTQAQIAERAGVHRNTITQAEKGQSSLRHFVAIMQGLGLEERLGLLFPEDTPSPIQLAKLQGEQRQRASGKRHSGVDEDELSW